LRDLTTTPLGEGTQTGELHARRLLAGEQNALYARIAGAQDGNIADALRDLDGGKALIRAYAEIGMPRTLTTNDVFASLMSGDSGIPEGSYIAAFYSAAAPHVDSTDDGDPATTALKGIMTDRIEAFKAVAAAVDRSTEARKVEQTIPLLETTQSDLALADRLNVAASTPRGGTCGAGVLDAFPILGAWAGIRALAMRARRRRGIAEE
jgi:hypothetical protein